MAMIIGAAAVKVEPVARGFHRSLKNIIDKEKGRNKIEIPVELDDKGFVEKLRYIEAQAEKLDGKVITIDVDVDDAMAYEKINNLRRAAAEGAEFHVKVDEDSARAAEKQLNALGDSGKVINYRTNVDNRRASSDMEDFFAKFNNRTINIKSKMDFGKQPTFPSTVGPATVPPAAQRPAQQPLPQTPPDPDDGANVAQPQMTQRRDPHRPFMTQHGARGTRDVRLRPQFGETDSINAIPKYIDMMNLEMAKGMKRLGDVYFQVPERMIGRLVNSMRNVTSGMANARTLSEGFAATLADASRVLNQMRQTADNVAQSMDKAKAAMSFTRGAINNIRPSQRTETESKIPNAPPRFPVTQAIKNQNLGDSLGTDSGVDWSAPHLARFKKIENEMAALSARQRVFVARLVDFSDSVERDFRRTQAFLSDTGRKIKAIGSGIAGGLGAVSRGIRGIPAYVKQIGQAFAASSFARTISDWGKAIQRFDLAMTKQITGAVTWLPRKLGEAGKKAASALGSSLTNGARSAGRGLKSFFSDVALGAQVVGEGMVDLARKIDGALGNVGSRSLRGIKSVFSDIALGAQVVREHLSNLAQMARTHVPAAFRSIADSVKNLVAGTFPSLYGSLKSLGDEFRKAWASVDGSIFTRLGATLSTAMPAFARDFRSHMEDVARGGVDGFTRVIHGMEGASRGVFTGLDFTEVLGDDGQWQRIKNRLVDPMEGFKKATARASLSAMDFKKKMSGFSIPNPFPSRRFKKSTSDGAKQASAFSQGFARSTAAASTSSSKSANRFFGAFKKQAAQSGNAIHRSMSKAASATSNWAKTATGNVRHAGGQINKILDKSFASIGGSKGLKKGLDVIGSRISARLVGMHKMIVGSFNRVGAGMMKAMLPAIASVIAGLLVMGGQTVIAAIMALGGAIGSVVGGAALMLPAIAGALGGVFLALKIGLDGVKDGVSAAFGADDIEAFETAIEDLHPKVQQIARGLREFKPAVDEMKDAVQNNLLDGLSDNISSAMGNLLPVFSEGLKNIATEWNTILANGFDQLSTPEASSGMADIFAGTQEMSANMSNVLADLIAGFGHLAQQGAYMLGPLGNGLSNMSSRFREWVDSLSVFDEDLGMTKFQSFMERMGTNAEYLGKIFGGLGGVIGNVFAAGHVGGGGMLSGMAKGLQDLKKYTSEGNEGFDNMVGFMESATEAASQLGEVLKPAFNIVMSVGTVLTSVASTAIPGLTVALDGVAESFGPLEEIAEGFGQNIGNILEAFGPALSQLGDVLAPLLSGLGQGLENMFVPMGEALDPVMTSLASFAEKAEGPLAQVGTAFGTIFEAAGPIIEKLITAVEPFLPVFGTFAEQFGNVIGAVLDGLGPALDAAGPAMAIVADALMKIYEAVGPALVNVINALMPLLPPIVEAFGAIVAALVPVLPIIIEIIAKFVEFAAVILGALAPVLPIILGALMSLAAPIGVVAGLIVVFVKLSAFINGPVAKAIKMITTLWKLLSLAFAMSPIGLVITLIAALVAGLIYFFTQTETGKALWEKFTNALGDAWNWFMDILQKAWDWLKDFFTVTIPGWLEVFQRGFEKAVDIVGGIWDGLKSLFAKPIKFFIETVWNAGLVDTWNKIVDKVPFLGDDKKLNHQPLPAGLKYATGGVLPGYSPGRDIHQFESPTGGRLLLSGGEAIMRPEWTRAVGGPAAVEEMNRQARGGKLKAPHRHGNEAAAFANGGVIGAMMNIVRQKYPQLTMTSGLRPGDGGMHGSGNATDWSNGSGNTPAQLALAKDIARTYPGSAELIYDSPGWSGNIKNGSNVGAFGQYYTMAQAGPHHHHVHWGMTTAPTMPFGGGVFEGGSNGGGGGGGNPLWGIVKGLLDKAWEKITAPVEKVASETGVFGGIPKGIATNLWDSATSHLRELIPFTSGGGGGNADWEPGAGAEQWRPMLKRAFKNQGEQGTQARVDALIRQIHTESGGDPNIAQQIVDVNGTGESAGVGLYQVIPTTWAGYRDPALSSNRRDPWAQHNFAVRYFRDRHNWNMGPGGVGRGHGWKTGGVLPDNIAFFDQGGLARGIGSMPKNTIKPERVLSPTQTLAFDEFIYGLIPQMIEAWRSQPKTFKDMTEEIVSAITLGNISLEEMRKERVSVMAKALETALRNDRESTNRKAKGFFGEDQGPIGQAGMMLGMAALAPEEYLEAEDEAYKAQEEREQNAQDSASSSADTEPVATESEPEPVEYQVEYEKDEDGEVKLDDNGDPIPVVDENGEPVLALDENGDPIPVEVENDFNSEDVQDVRIVEDISDGSYSTSDSEDVDTAETDFDSEDSTVDEDDSTVPVEVENAEEVAPEAESETEVGDNDALVGTDADSDDEDDSDSTSEYAFDSDEGSETADVETPEVSDSEEATDDTYVSSGDVQDVRIVEDISDQAETPVEVEYEKDEDGEVKLDDNGDPIPVEVEADPELASAATSMEDAAEADADNASRQSDLLDKEEDKELSENEKRYGFEALNKDGSNPNEYEQSEQEKLFRSTLNAVASPIGFGGLVTKLEEKADVTQSLASGIMTAMPAWTSAVTGVGTAVATGNFAAIPGAIAGLAHNVAAASAQAAAQTASEFMELVPSAISGTAEMLLSSTALSSQQPLIGTVNSGMSPRELTDTLTHYDLKNSRRGGGTPRMK